MAAGPWTSRGAAAHKAAHARGAPADAGLAAGLAAPADPGAAVAEVRWALGHSSPGARDALRRLPAPSRAAGRLGELIRAPHLTVAAGG
jgi:hypothetical protein